MSRARNFVSAFWIFCASIAATGCTAIFLPPYDAEITAAVAQSYRDVSEITACIDLALCTTPASFADMRRNYTGAVAGLKTARLLAEQRGTGGTPAADANASFVRLIDGCQQAVAGLIRQHRARGVPAGAGFSRPVDVACNQTLRAAQAQRR